MEFIYRYKEENNLSAGLPKLFLMRPGKKYIQQLVAKKLLFSCIGFNNNIW